MFEGACLDNVLNFGAKTCGRSIVQSFHLAHLETCCTNSASGRTVTWPVIALRHSLSLAQKRLTPYHKSCSQVLLALPRRCPPNTPLSHGLITLPFASLPSPIQILPLPPLQIRNLPKNLCLLVTEPRHLYIFQGKPWGLVCCPADVSAVVDLSFVSGGLVER